MTIIETIRQLVSAMEPATAKDEALKIGVLAILEKVSKSDREEKKEQPEPKKKTKRGRKPFDIGKAQACRNAGWSVAKIADEMGVSEQTVRNNLAKAEGENDDK